jgi:hypothetical protein
LQQQVKNDAMLQNHLSGPFAINGGELLLGLDAVIVDAEKLALRGSAHQGGKHGGFMRGEQLLNRGALIAQSTSKIRWASASSSESRPSCALAIARSSAPGAGGARPVFGGSDCVSFWRAAWSSLMICWKCSIFRERVRAAPVSG